VQEHKTYLVSVEISSRTVTVRWRWMHSSTGKNFDCIDANYVIFIVVTKCQRQPYACNLSFTVDVVAIMTIIIIITVTLSSECREISSPSKPINFPFLLSATNIYNSTACVMEELSGVLESSVLLRYPGSVLAMSFPTEYISINFHFPSSLIPYILVNLLTDVIENVDSSGKISYPEMDSLCLEC
jgi:hypothetical protein